MHSYGAQLPGGKQTRGDLSLAFRGAVQPHAHSLLLTHQASHGSKNGHRADGIAGRQRLWQPSNCQKRAPVHLPLGSQHLQGGTAWPPAPAVPSHPGFSLLPCRLRFLLQTVDYALARALPEHTDSPCKAVPAGNELQAGTPSPTPFLVSLRSLFCAGAFCSLTGQSSGTHNSVWPNFRVSHLSSDTQSELLLTEESQVTSQGHS